jgi:hypothetical protein
MADLKESSLFLNVEDQRRHWYYHYKTRVIGSLLDHHLVCGHGGLPRGGHPEERQLRGLDIGAGNGIISRSLGSNLGGRAIKWDLVDSAYDQDALGCDRHDALITLYTAIPEGATYDVIIAIDVVEHIENDSAFVSLLEEHLARDGLMMICVPAFQFLWSNHDVFLEHYRRYRRRDLVLMMRRTGLQVVDSGYLYVLLFPIVAAIRLVGHIRHGDSDPTTESEHSDLRVYPELINRLLRGVMGFERKLLHLFPFVGKAFGVSCFAVGVQASSSSSELAARSITSRKM